jgi:hypothetical protein
MQDGSRKDDCASGSNPAAIKTYPVEEKAWKELARKDPDDVCRRAMVTYNRDGA